MQYIDMTDIFDELLLPETEHKIQGKMSRAMAYAVNPRRGLIRFQIDWTEDELRREAFDAVDEALTDDEIDYGMSIFDKMFASVYAAVK